MSSFESASRTEKIAIFANAVSKSVSDVRSEFSDDVLGQAAEVARVWHGGVRPGGGAADDGCLKSRHRAAVRNSRRGTIAVLRDLSVGDILL